ncbi:MAG: hypothetical protein A2840_01865 [Candidatus Buchananbacteria bacterium RIFCSPHIGHO2_01_FULL_47_11b]|uniref:Glutamyl-tRNA amidotransferase n=1 Tax=Candidatus Buchananbacteria bacterium RIFCSPHIGHO2_01_FULL_47_11b TaxID=1797537 RepID=A0A1G1Y4V0_9BACT|nr:MAG: hypothetical protein A2840_01865 [Candidatus Buchananbacteria bacterium RIFCSPHIGHO2_01_FULL_47_11b]
MDVRQQIDSDLTASLKKRDEVKVLTLRGVKTAFSNVEIANNRTPLTEEQIIKILKSEVKKRRDAAALYEQGGSQERADKEKKEIEIISAYLPAELSDEEIQKAVTAMITEMGASTPADMGKVIGAVMARLKGDADGSRVSALVKAALHV